MTRLELERRKKNMTQLQLAKRAGCSGSLVCCIELGHREITAERGPKLAEALGLPASAWPDLKRQV